MCGINGFTWEDDALAKRMNEAIKHRGPDDEGVHVENGVTLGHRRLSILDLSDAGHQPMHYAKGGASSTKHNTRAMRKSDLSIVFNGEVYNFQELREELKTKGYAFTTGTDTEVVLASYREWGEACVQRFNGMWAFCIHDKPRRRLFLSRDRLGQKPLYYHHGEGFIFSSELKGILEQLGTQSIDPEAVDLYFPLGFIPAPWTIYKRVRKLEAGTNLMYDLTNDKLTKRAYYTKPRYRPLYDRKYLVEKGRELLKDATRLRMIADVPVGAFLSGGLDSSAVVGEMASFTRLSNLHTFSIGFREAAYDETAYMEVARKHYATKHHHEYFTEKDFENYIDTMARCFDEPFGDYALYPNYKVSVMARKHVTVALSGDGGDELFGGYTMHHIAAQLAALRRVPRFVRRLGHAFLSLLPKRAPLSFTNKAYEALRLSLLPPERFFAEANKSFVPKPKVYIDWTTKRLKESLKLAKGDFVEAMIQNDRYHYTLADYFLQKVDRTAMATALEVRSPFLDYRLVEHSAKIPSEWKTTTRAKKLLMREIIQGLVPESIRTRSKRGFDPPLDEWILKPKYQRQMKEFLKKSPLNTEWVHFLKDAMGRQDKLLRSYQVRLFLFMQWFLAGR